MYSLPEPSAFLLISFSAIVAAVTFALVWAAGLAESSPQARTRARRRAALVLAVWLGGSGALAAAGVLSDFSPPPRLPLLLFGMVGATLWLGLSPYGGKLARQLPLWLLLGISAFRLPLELVMHRAYTEGIMPIQMSYSGRNFDILTGALAIAGGLLAYRGKLPRRAALVINCIGLALLANVVGVAILSIPTPLRVFLNEPPNVWIARLPFVWLPALLVQTALLSHVLVFRHLRAEASASPRVSSESSAATPGRDIG